MRRGFVPRLDQIEAILTSLNVTYIVASSRSIRRVLERVSVHELIREDIASIIHHRKIEEKIVNRLQVLAVEKGDRVTTRFRIEYKVVDYDSESENDVILEVVLPWDSARKNYIGVTAEVFRSCFKLKKE